MDQYIMWKLMKVMGKMILEYLSMSLARIPKIRSGGALRAEVHQIIHHRLGDGEEDRPVHHVEAREENGEDHPGVFVDVTGTHS